jgi:hypothetical protein
MAEAGFVFCGLKKEPDLTQCQVCLKKLDGWEQDDDPWYVEFCFENLTRREGWCCIRTFVKILLGTADYQFNVFMLLRGQIL